MSATFTRSGLVRAALVPALWVFALPVFSLWFGHHIEADYDEQLRSSALESVAADPTLTPEDRVAARAFYESLSGALVCADTSPELEGLRQNLSGVCDDYLQFRWMQRIAASSIALGLLTGLLAGAAAGAAFLRREAQIPAFAFGWNLMRVTSAIQVAAQGVLAVALSFWITAFWFQSYSLKLIFVVGALALVGAGAVIVAIFARSELRPEVDGAEIGEARAPRLWARLRELAGRVGTDPPARVIGGIDDNFFVTESDIDHLGSVRQGRTLYVSLSLLRVLTRGEADAVLAHELAHFSGGDTAHSRTLAPMEARYLHYLSALYQNFVARPVFYPMLAFWSLFQMASAAAHRERELRADRIAAEQRSPREVAAALLKVAAYATFRREVERTLFAEQQVLEHVGIAERVRQGFASFAGGAALGEQLAASTVAHPLDTHPPNAERFTALGVSLPPASWASVLLEPVTDSWNDDIDGAAEIEARQWQAYERRFAENHELSLAYRTTPTTSEQKALVERHFPPIQFLAREGGVTATMDYLGLRANDWDAPLLFEGIASAELKDELLGKTLIAYGPGNALSRKKTTIKLKRFADADAFLAAFNRYWHRSQVAASARKG